MVLVDTSVWIDHLRNDEAALVSLLNNDKVVIHPFVTGELACGNLQKRSELLNLFQNLPQSPVASQQEVLFFIEHHHLMGRGIGFIDAHLLAATALQGAARLWTRDKRLDRLAVELHIAMKKL